MDDTSASAILALQPADARKLFPGTADEITARFRQLVKLWHPDAAKNEPKAPEVFAHISKLRDIALSRGGGKAQVREFYDGSRMIGALNFIRSRKFDAGEIFIGPRTIAYLIHSDYADLMPAADGFKPKFATKAVENEMTRFLPNLAKSFETTEGSLRIYRRTPDQILLSDLIDEVGPIDPRHVAWMISGMLNLACFLNVSNLVHGDIGPDSLLVSVEHHGVAFCSPFVYLSQIGERPKALPNRTMNVVPRMRTSGVGADAYIDPELIRLTAREALGDPAGARMRLNPAIPPQIAMWLMAPAGKDALDDYRSWEKTRDASFKKEFVKWDFNPATIYGATQ